MGEYIDCDVYKFEGLYQQNPPLAGNWYEGARAYLITLQIGAKNIRLGNANGVMSVDWMLCDGIVDMQSITTIKLHLKLMLVLQRT